MAGFSKIYCIGGEGGFQGADGINPLLAQILVGDADRQWLEPVYVAPELTPLGRVKTIVPKGPDDPDALLDACIAFFPGLLGDCPSMSAIRSKLRDVEFLDFDRGDGVPAEWPKLRTEAAPAFSKLAIWEANLKRIGK